MKYIIKTNFAALLFVMSIACKKENNTIQSSDTSHNSAVQADITENKVAAGRTVKIGTQVWVSKNLDVNRYRNGDKIPQVKSAAKWAALTTGAWCWYNNDSATGAVYGKLYNWYAVNDPRGLVPVGWHVPSDSEWTTLTTFLRGDAVAGGKMKEAGTTHWQSPNTGATNSSGFTGLPGGYRYFYGPFSNVSDFGGWWSSTEYGTDFAWYRNLYYGNGYVNRVYNGKQSGYSVRCLRD